MIPWIAALVSVAWATDDGYRMNDLGGTVYLPKGWTSTEWADWSLKAKSSDGVLAKIWFTPFQVEITDEAVDAWAEMYLEDLTKQGLGTPKITAKKVGTVGDTKVGIVEMSFRLKGKGAGRVFFYAVPGAGKVVHIRTLTGQQKAKAAQAVRAYLFEKMELDSGPLPTEGPGVESGSGFAATLPEGWRVPLTNEMEAVREISGKVDRAGLSPDDCWVAIRPPAVGDPDVMFACTTNFYMGPVDEHSFAAEEEVVHERYFGSVDVPPAEMVDVGDRDGFYFRPPPGVQTVRLALAPYGGGSLMEMWGMAAHMDEGALDADMLAVLPSVTFTGDDGGQPVIGVDKWVGYYLKHRTTSPVVLVPMLCLIALVGGGFMVLNRRKNDYDDLD